MRDAPSLSYAKYELTFSTLLTLVRIFCVPFIYMAFVNEDWLYGTFLFVIAGITDILDGFCARLLLEESFLGALLDPLADKILMIATYSALFLAPNTYMPGWFLIIIVIKEVSQMLGTSILVWYKGIFTIRPLKLAKATMAAQWFFVVLMGVSSVAQWELQGFFEGALMVIVSLIMISFCCYIYRAYELLPRYVRMFSLLVGVSLPMVVNMQATSPFCLKVEPKKKISSKKVTEELLHAYKEFLTLSNAIVEQLAQLNQESVASFEAILIGEDKRSTTERLEKLQALQQLNDAMEQFNHTICHKE